MINGTHLEIFNERVFQEDRQEAIQVNALYDSSRQSELFATRGAGALALSSLSREAENDQFGAAHYGHDTAQHAARWLDYRGAYIADMGQAYAGLDAQPTSEWSPRPPKPHERHIDHINDLQDIHLELQEKFVLGDGLYVAFFAQLHKRLVQTVVHTGGPFIDPLKTEFNLATSLLLVSLDATLTEATADNNGTLGHVLNIYDENETHTRCRLERSDESTVSHYIVGLQKSPDPDEVASEDTLQLYLTRSTAGSSLRAAAYGGVEAYPDTPSILNLVRLIDRQSA